VAKGYWIRLRARSFFFEDRQGHALALVSADLFAVPGGLKARVAELVQRGLADAKLDVRLPPESIVLAATHTHQGPGNFMTSAIYNQFASSFPGFSRPLFDFLAKRIASAVVASAIDARSRKETVQLRLRTGEVGHGLLVNRAPRTFLLNLERDSILSALDDGTKPVCEPLPGEPATEWQFGACPRLRAIDRGMTILEVSSGGTPLGALLFFAAHPSVLEAAAPLYSPDVFGYAAQALRDRFGAVGFFNGAEGDVVARRTQRDFADVAILGERLAEAALRIGEQPSTSLDAPDIQVKARAVDLTTSDQRTCGAARLSEQAVFGSAAMGGAEGDRTALYDLGWREGPRGKPGGDQAGKLPALDSPLLRPVKLTKDFAPPGVFPRWLPIAEAAIGPLRLLAVPFEASTAEGVALRAALGGAGHGALEIVGLSNEYASYVATREEYGAQDYMGASTLWGPNEGSFAACVATRLEPVAAGAVPAGRFAPGPGPDEPFGPSFLGAVERPDDGLDRVLLELSGEPERKLPWFKWREPEPASMAQTSRRVSIWQLAPSGWRPLEDDRGSRFFTAALEASGTWSAIWLSPLLERAVRMRSRGDRPPAPALSGTFAFVVEWKGAPLSCSEAFMVGGDAPVRHGSLAEAPCDSYRR
jgi:neutral ceramidase